MRRLRLVLRGDEWWESMSSRTSKGAPVFIYSSHALWRMLTAKKSSFLSHLFLPFCIHRFFGKKTLDVRPFPSSQLCFSDVQIFDGVSAHELKTDSSYRVLGDRLMYLQYCSNRESLIWHNLWKRCSGVGCCC